MERTASVAGSYALLHRIAGGAVAEVYLARGADRSGQEQLVCVRKLSPALRGDAASAGRFLGEAQQTSLFRHPNIARVVEIGGDYCATEYVHGSDLSRVLAMSHDGGVPLSLDAAIAIALAICAGLHHAHELVGPDGARLGVLHRGLAPRTVLVGYDGAVKLVGFALPQPRLRTAQLAYASPEAAAGHPLDRRSDVYSLGAILYELTAGTRPTPAGAVPPSQLVPGYPAALESIVMRALARDPAQRTPSIEHLAGDLDAVARASSLPTTSAAIARVMSTLFPGRLEDWHAARAQGQFFVEQHVLSALTAEGTGSHAALSASPDDPPLDDAPTSLTPLPGALRRPFVAVGSAPGVASIGERTEIVRTKGRTSRENTRELESETMLVSARAPRRIPLVALLLGGAAVAALGVFAALHSTSSSASPTSTASVPTSTVVPPAPVAPAPIQLVDPAISPSLATAPAVAAPPVAPVVVAAPVTDPPPVAPPVASPPPASPPSVPAWRRTRVEAPPAAPRPQPPKAPPAAKAPPPKVHKAPEHVEGQPYDDDSPFMPVRSSQ